MKTAIGHIAGSDVESKSLRVKLSLRHIVAAVIGGGGLMYCVEVLAGSQSKAVIDMLGSFGPLFIVAAGMLYVLDRRMGQFISTSREFTGDLVGAMTQNAVAQQRTADAISTIAQKDDQRARETELVLGHLARTSEKILDKVNALEAARG